MSLLNPRHQVLVELVPEAEIIIDVGADHGYVAKHLGAIATERMPHRRGSTHLRWVIADGLRCFRKADVAIIAGMGAAKIEAILADAPPISTIVVHATDSPARLRRFLAGNGWKIDDERLAPEGRGYAEVIRAVPGQESVSDLALEFGPVLITRNGPYHQAHFQDRKAYWENIRNMTAEIRPQKAEYASRRIGYLVGLINKITQGDDKAFT
jgi:tRNA (adenine22-N1)-methyltransferase